MKWTFEMRKGVKHSFLLLFVSLFKDNSTFILSFIFEAKREKKNPNLCYFTSFLHFKCLYIRINFYLLRLVIHDQIKSYILHLLTFQTPKFSANHINICFWDSIAKVVMLKVEELPLL